MGSSPHGVKSRPKQVQIHSCKSTCKWRGAPFKTTVLYLGLSMSFHVNLGEGIMVWIGYKLGLDLVSGRFDVGSTRMTLYRSLFAYLGLTMEFKGQKNNLHVARKPKGNGVHIRTFMGALYLIPM